PPNPDVARAIPRAGVPVSEIPRDADGADASRFALERNGVVIEVQWVRVMPVEARTASGELKRTDKPYTVVALRRRQAGDAQQFADNIRDRYAPAGGDLKLRLTDSRGNELPRQEFDLGVGNNGVTRGSPKFPVAVNDEVAAFSAPPAGFDKL